MPHNFNRRSKGPIGIFLFLAALSYFTSLAYADLDSIGVSLLQAVTTNLDGSGVWIVQAEAALDTNQPPAFEVNPDATGNSPGLFSYFSSVGMDSSFPNSVGNESWHADQVGMLLYGLSGGVATNVVHVDNYEANYFVNSIVANTIAINGQIVNQSFIFQGINISQQQMIDSAYDDYATRYSTLFVSGIGNGGPVNAPSTCYNGIGVGAYGGDSSVGPTPDNGRAKPDLVAPAGATSYSTPQVAGTAALLLQAGLRGDGGSDTNSAADLRTIKALLLNGAIKPADWTNVPPSPLDVRYGAGVLNAFNSYEQLAGGKHGYILSLSVPTNSPHPPTSTPLTISGLTGWDFNTINSDSTSNGVNHYFFDATNGFSNGTFTATATLVWNRQNGQTSINDLDLFLYDARSGRLIASSTSLVDNVEHLFVTGLAPGRYDLQVLKQGGMTVSAGETYAVAFEFFSTRLAIARSGVNNVISWPIYPTGFVLESTADLTTWTTNNPAPVLASNLFNVTVPTSGGNQFFRLRRP